MKKSFEIIDENLLKHARKPFYNDQMHVPLTGGKWSEREWNAPEHANPVFLAAVEILGDGIVILDRGKIVGEDRESEREGFWIMVGQECGEIGIGALQIGIVFGFAGDDY